MLFIVAHHYVVNSGMMDNMWENPWATNSLFFFVFGAWGKIAINCFVLITGYFMCKSHITVKKFLKLVLQIEFYNITFYFIFMLSGYESFSVFDFLKHILIVKNIDSGFVSAFIVFFLFIPFLNILLKHLNEKMHTRLILLCLFLYTFLNTMSYFAFSVNMNYVSWFIVVYFIASYVRLYPRKMYENTKTWAVLSIISIVLSIMSILGSLRFIWREPYYFIADSNKLLAIITAFCLFMFFKNVKIPYIKLINIVASASFGVLLIHSNSDVMHQWLWKDTLQNAEMFNTSWCYIHFICSVFGIYIICTCIDLLRIYLLKKPFFKLYDKHSQVITSCFYRVEDKLLKRFHIKS